MKQLAFAAALIASSAMAQDEEDKKTLNFDVSALTGNCPTDVTLQENSTYGEAAIHKVTAQHQEFAGSYEVGVQEKKKSTFEAELLDEYANCKGEAYVVVGAYQWDIYKLDFIDGRVTLTIELEDAEMAAGVSSVTHAEVLETGAAYATWRYGAE